MSAHQSLGASLGALVYSWVTFEISRMYFKRGSERGAFIWGGLATIVAVIYFFVAAFSGQWFGAILSGATVGLEGWLMKRQFDGIQSQQQAKRTH